MKRAHLALPAVAAVLALSACGLVYTRITYPRAYRSATPADVKAGKTDEVARGQSCSYSLIYLVAWGDAGYGAATRNALKGREGAVLYDVKTDVEAQSVLMGIFTRFCTIVTGKVAFP